jgi:hypothetical protein
MPRGGSRAGAGRKKGTTDSKLRKFAVDEVMRSIGSGPDKSPLAFLMSVIYLPPEADVKMSERIQCAIAAARYCHPALAAVEVKKETHNHFTIQTDLGQALKQLAEMARTRTIDLDPNDVEVLEAGAFEEDDKSGGN